VRWMQALLELHGWLNALIFQNGPIFLSFQSIVRELQTSQRKGRSMLERMALGVLQVKRVKVQFTMLVQMSHLSLAFNLLVQVTSNLSNILVSTLKICLLQKLSGYQSSMKPWYPINYSTSLKLNLCSSHKLVYLNETKIAFAPLLV